MDAPPWMPARAPPTEEGGRGAAGAGEEEPRRCAVDISAMPSRRRSAAEGHAGEDRAPPREFRRPTEEGAGAGRSPRQQGREREAGRAG
jgi:hypothetical protein